MSKRKKRYKKKTHVVSGSREIKSFTIPIWEEHPDLTSLGIILLLLLIFFFPVIFSNKTLLPPDAIASRSFHSFVKDALSRGVYPLWNPYIFCGMPSLASLSTAPYTNILNQIIMKSIWVLSLGFIDPATNFLRIFVYYFLFGAFTYLLLRSKRLNPEVALFSAIGIVFMPQIVAYSAFGHNTKLCTAVFIPLIFLLVDRLLKKQNIFYFSLTSLVVGLQFLCAHIQICFYTQLMAGLYLIFWIVNTLRERKSAGKIVKGVCLYGGAVLIALLISSVLYFSVWEYSHYSIRGGGPTGGLEYGYATNWSFPPSEIATYFIPSFMGFGGDTYWGPMPFTDFPLYFGLIIFMLAGLALIINRNRTVWFFTILSVIVLFISFGKYLPVLYGPMFKFFPFFNKFRAPKMIQVLLQFSMVILAGYGLQGITQFHSEGDGKRIGSVKRYLMIFGGVVLIFFLILLFGRDFYMGWASKARGGRVAAAAAYDKAIVDGLKAIVFFIFSYAIVMRAMKKRISSKWVPFVLAGFVFIDFWIVDHRFVNLRPKREEKSYFQETSDVKFLKEKDGEFRIWPIEDRRMKNSRGPNWYMYHLIQSISGYQGARVRIFGELRDQFQPYLFSTKSPELRRRFLKLTNVRYVVSPFDLTRLDSTFKPVFFPLKKQDRAVYEFTDSLPRIFFPHRVIQVIGKDNILRYMMSSDFDPSDVAVIEKRAPLNISYSDSNRAKILKYDIDKIEIEGELFTNSLLVLSDVYYPAGWKAYVDGKETEIYKTNYAFRGIFMRPGRHKIEFVFRPRSFKIGLITSISAFSLVLLGLVVGIRLRKRKE